MKPPRLQPARRGFPPFLASEVPNLPAAECRFHVIPVPFERSVSYGRGTAEGPAAILRASYQLEAFDGHGCPCEQGIWTTAPVECGGTVTAALARVEAAVGAALGLGATPVVLGGEHTVTLGAVRACASSHRRLGVIQFDAHADLRDSYEGTPYSHACVMRRVSEIGVPFLQIGVRALSPAEAEFRKSAGIPHFDAEGLAIARTPPARLLPRSFPRDVYVTFDVDALDPGIMPATGTPEPGGLQWWQTMALLRRVTEGRRIVGFDVVELAPVRGLHGPDFTAARLAYNLMGIAAVGPR
jgi:agmatinase